MLYVTYTWITVVLRARLSPMLGRDDRGATVLEYVLMGVGGAILAGLAYAAFKTAIQDGGNQLKTRGGEVK